MGRPWAELSSPERLDAVLLAVAELNEECSRASAGAVALRVSRDHEMEMAGWGKNARRNGLRRMSTATRVTPAITALRGKRGLLASGWDDGPVDVLTVAGEERVRELRAQSSEEDGI